MKIITFYLPQFHRVPENDRWWGDGFTEWTNTRKAKPLFDGHRQPRVPQKSNYYNLLDPMVQAWQANLAKKFGIHGFCYYHYWFNGRRLLEKPLENILSAGRPDFPFCLSWANEPWTKTWEGNDKEVLMAQTYGDRDEWLAHIDYLLRCFKDDRYIKVDGCPVFLIYRPGSIPRLSEMLDLWRCEARKAGFQDLHIVGTKTIFADGASNNCIDAWTALEPLTTYAFGLPLGYTIVRKLRSLIRRTLVPSLSTLWPARPSYDLLWSRILKKKIKENTYPAAFVDWDNSARKKEKGLIVNGFTSEKFRKYLTKLIVRVDVRDKEFLFINAWNEWAEGAYLEPDTETGELQLEAVQEAIDAHRLAIESARRGGVLKVFTR